MYTEYIYIKNVFLVEFELSWSSPFNHVNNKVFHVYYRVYNVYTQNMQNVHACQKKNVFNQMLQYHKNLLLHCILLKSLSLQCAWPVKSNIIYAIVQS